MANKNDNKNTVSYQEALVESLKDVDEAEAYLNVALDEYDQDGDYEAFMLALKNIADANGGVNQLAKKTHLNRQNLYRVLSKDGNPRLDTLSAVIHGPGFKLSVSKVDKAA
jgi:probable addiction module antidote protein